MPENSTGVLQEKLYTVKEVAAILRKSSDWVRREFREYPGIIRSGTFRPGKHQYTTLLIPESVLVRWIREHRVSVFKPKSLSLSSL